MMKKRYLFICLIAVATHAQHLPKSLEHTYETEANPRYSDEFNADRKHHKFDASKWHYRQPKPWRKGLATGKEYVQEKDGKLICFGRKHEKKAGGIVSNNYFQYGFYAFRWKTTGIHEEGKNVWHPSVWGSLDDTQKGKVPYTSGKGDSWMEIDIMEFSTWKASGTDWNADAPAYIWVDSIKKRAKVNKLGKKFGWRKAMMTDGKKDKYKGKVIGSYGFNEWQTMGMEYHPDYLQLWLVDEGEWVPVGHRIHFTDNNVKPSLRTVPKKAVKPLYWYIGNLYMPQGKAAVTEEQITECTFEVDWFHFYDLKK
ncbi:LamG domain-containing protein [Ochrovirga pacifica]|uniref:hypothetical protein n=1 Tax=Ochrovirga pacifica TaxID=1042376 RepID=UPI0002FF4FF9|nr:hypothetical protein [Ochrovirga pacifica]